MTDYVYTVTNIARFHVRVFIHFTSPGALLMRIEVLARPSSSNKVNSVDKEEKAVKRELLYSYSSA